MATAFDFTSYPLDGDTGFTDEPQVLRDIMDDGTPHVRVVGGSSYRRASLVFQPTNPTETDTLLDYLNTNRATEFTFSGSGWGAKTYTGFLWSEPEADPIDGYLYRVTVDVYARRSA